MYQPIRMFQAVPHPQYPVNQYTITSSVIMCQIHVKISYIIISINNSKAWCKAILHSFKLVQQKLFF